MILELKIHKNSNLIFERLDLGTVTFKSPKKNHNFLYISNTQNLNHLREDLKNSKYFLCKN